MKHFYYLLMVLKFFYFIILILNHLYIILDNIFFCKCLHFEAFFIIWSWSNRLSFSLPLLRFSPTIANRAAEVLPIILPVLSHFTSFVAHETWIAYNNYIRDGDKKNIWGQEPVIHVCFFITRYNVGSTWLASNSCPTKIMVSFILFY